MADNPQYQAGDTADVDGNQYTFDGKAWNLSTPATGAATPSTWEDIKSGSLPWLARGTEGALGTAGALGDLAGKGVSWVGNKIGSQNIENEGKSLQDISSYATPETIAKVGDPLVQKAGFDPNYQPQTDVGRYVRTGEQFLPGAVAAGMLGPEAMATSLLRGAGAAAGSETLGHAVEDFTGEGSTEGALARGLGGVLGGAYAPRAVTPFPTTSPLRTQAANTTQSAIEPYGGYVNAAQKTGSPRLQSILGEPQDNSVPVTQALMQKGGVPWQPGQKFDDALDAATSKWRQDFDWSKQQPIMRDPQFWSDVQGVRAQAQGSLTAGLPAHDAQLKEIEDAYKAFQQLPAKGAPLTSIDGAKYLDLKDTLQGSNNTYVQKMGNALDAAGKRSNPAWDDLSTRWADLKGLKAGAEEAGSYGGALKPGTVADAMIKSTPMRQTAQAAQAALSPVKAAQGTGLADLIPALGGSYLGLHTGVTGLDPIWGLLAGQAAKPALSKLASPLFKNKAVQGYLGNQALTAGNKLTPSQAALLLAGPTQQRLTGP